MTDSDPQGRFGWWTVVTTCAIVLSATATATWYVARAHVDDEIRQYERSKDWQLPALLKQLGEVSKRVTLEVQERQELERLRTEIKDLAQKNAAVSSHLDAALSERDGLKKALAELQGDRFELRQGEARVLVPGELAVGVKSFSADDAEIQFGQELRRVTAGTTLTAVAGGKRYAVTVLRVDRWRPACAFSVTHAPAAKR